MIDANNFTNLDQHHYAILKSIKFSTELHGLLGRVISNQGLVDKGLHMAITNLIYLPTLLNTFIRDELKKFLISDCQMKMKSLECEFNPDLLQIIYLDLVILGKLVDPGIHDQDLFQLFIDLADVNIAEIHLFLIRLCIEKGWEYEFTQE